MQTKCLSDRMKSLSAKRITAMIAGAALLGVGLAFSGPVSFSSVPIISPSGQPVVQVVVGSGAKPSDGVAAANIAAAIGNLAFTTMPVKASINTTQALSVLHVSVSSPTYSLTNQQVWLNESASALTSGTYGFSTLIGSVLNGGIQLGSLQSTKSLQGTGSQYSYPEKFSTSATPAPSPYTGVGFVPLATSVAASNNGGGVSFPTFQAGSKPTNDNILEVSHSQFSGLLSNAGSYGENEYLWLTGFPVYDQASGVNNFALLDANGAYQITFNKPINVKTSSNTINQATFSLLGQNYTVINYTPPGTFSPSSSTNFTTGGSMYIASSLTPFTTVNVTGSLTSGGFKVVLDDLGLANSNGISPAAISVYYNGALTNRSSIMPPNTTKFNVSGHYLYVDVNKTFAGRYAYAKWAEMRLYSNVFQIKSGSSFNTTTNPNWYTVLQWVNASGSTTGPVKADALQSIVIYGTSSEAQTLLPGQSFSFITSPAIWKLQFIGQTLGSANYDPVTATLSAASPFEYSNPFSSSGLLNVTEPAQELTVTSSIPNAFSYAGQTSSSVVYDLTPYGVNDIANTVNPANTDNVVLTFTSGYNSLISPTYPLYVTITGYTSNSASSSYSAQVSFSNSLTTIQFNDSANSITKGFYNITGIQLSRAIPGINSIIVYNGPYPSNSANALAELEPILTGPQIVYTPSGKTVPSLTLANVIYNQQNGLPTNPFTIAFNVTAGPTGNFIPGVKNQYATYTMTEQPVPGNTAATDSLSFGIYNSTSGIGATPFFQLNFSTTGTHNNMTYTSTSNAIFNVQSGFITEKGSKVASITPTSLTVDFAKAVDELQFAVAPVSTTISKTYKLFGPYGIGQATNLPNVSIGAVNATITLSGTSKYNITGINNITATPTVSSADVPTLLKSLPTSPLVVLDSQVTNPSGSLILIGSGYVNSLSAQLQKAYNITMTPSTQIVQAYGNKILIAGYYANQTTAAANQFISDLYAAASTT